MGFKALITVRYIDKEKYFTDISPKTQRDIKTDKRIPPLLPCFCILRAIAWGVSSAMPCHSYEKCHLPLTVFGLAAMFHQSAAGLPVLLTNEGGGTGSNKLRVPGFVVIGIIDGKELLHEGGDGA